MRPIRNLLIGVLLVSTFGLAVPSAKAAKDMSQARAIVFYDFNFNTARANAANVRDMLVAGGWTETNIRLMALMAEDRGTLMSGLVGRWYNVPPGNTTLKFFYYSGHGGILDGDEGTADETGANNFAADNKDEFTSNLRVDDNLVWPAGLAGPKALVWQHCYAAGMWDGAADPFPSDAYIFGASDRTQIAYGNGATLGSDFTMIFLRGLLANGADAEANDGNGNGEVTLGELKKYVTDKYPPSWSTSPAPTEKFLAPAGLDTTVIANAIPVASNPVPAITQTPGGAQRGECISRGVPAAGSVGGVVLVALILTSGLLVAARRRSPARG